MPFPKHGKRMQTRKSVQAAIDRAESRKVPERSEGRCEVWVERLRGTVDIAKRRCLRGATQIHHMIGGNGKRGRGISALADHKQHVCDECHLAITGDLGGKKLKRRGGDIPRYTDVYERVR